MNSRSIAGCAAGRATSMSRHALRQEQRRSILQFIVDALLDFGMREPAPGGAERCYFTKHSWRDFAAYIGREARYFERFRSVYAIMAANGTVITTGWLH